MSRRTILSSSVLLAAIFACTLSPRPVRAQRLEDGESSLETKGRATRLLRVDLFKGVATADPANKTHQEAAAYAAKEVVYPLYWNTSTKTMPEPGKMNKLVSEFEGRLAQMTKFKAATTIFQHMYCKQVIDCVQEVALSSKQPIAVVNAARMLSLIPERHLDRGILQSEKDWAADVLPRLSDGNGEHLATVALNLLETPKMNDGARYYLLRTLSGLLGLPKQATPLVKPATEEKILAAAMKLAQKKVAFPKATPRGEVEGYKVLRRESVRVIATSRTPVVGDKERPALTLARVAGNDQSIVPPPRLDERIEAAIGLAKMAATAAKFPDYQPDYTMTQIAYCVRDFAIQADANREAKASFRARPWKVDAARMIEALDVLSANVKTKYVQDAVKQCLGVLSAIERGNQGNGGVLGEWLSTNPSPAKSVFKSSDDTVIKTYSEK